jgi:hypothetical protein
MLETRYVVEVDVHKEIVIQGQNKTVVIEG